MTYILKVKLAGDMENMEIPCLPPIVAPMRLLTARALVFYKRFAPLGPG